MRLFRRKKKDNQTIAENLPLILKGIDGETLFTIPENIILDLRRMVTRIDRVDKLPARLSLTSAISGEGVTYISRALAATISNDLDRTVCIVELNWWSPSSFVEPVNGGLAAVLHDEAVLEEEVIFTGWKKLSVLPSGSVSKLERPVMARSAALKEVIYELSDKFDHLILDVPAVQKTSDSIPLASLGNACCLVIQQGVTTIEDVKQSLDEIDHLSIVGTVLNQVHISTPEMFTNLIPN
jgi:Mrp family chromosome partitioning ATPase